MMMTYYKSGFEKGVIKFANYLKERAFLCDANDWWSFQAIDIDDLDDLIDDFFEKEDYL